MISYLRIIITNDHFLSILISSDFLSLKMFEATTKSRPSDDWDPPKRPRWERDVEMDMDNAGPTSDQGWHD